MIVQKRQHKEKNKIDDKCKSPKTQKIYRLQSRNCLASGRNLLDSRLFQKNLKRFFGFLQRFDNGIDIFFWNMHFPIRLF